MTARRTVLLRWPTSVGPGLGSAIWLVAASTIGSSLWVAARSATPPEAVPILFATGALCVAGLARRRAPSVAWLATIGAAFAAASLPIGLASAADPATVGVDAWLTWAAPAGVAALIALWIAAGYATRPDRRLAPWAVVISLVLVIWFALALDITVAAVLRGERADPAFTWIDVATVPIAWFRPFVAGLVALGAIADVREASRRAAERLPARAPARERAAATIRELVPGQAAAEDARAAEERTRLAGDLHASVVPSLRRAIEEAEAGAEPTTVLRHLRAADLELERLMADRWPVVLETFGLVAAIEDVAERLEADGAPPITIDIERADGRPPEAVERAAWRFVQIALDNAVRHADATSIDVGIAVDRLAVRVDVVDDGRGFDPDVASRVGARGIADATRRGGDLGATVAVGPGSARGTVARFEWVERAT